LQESQSLQKVTEVEAGNIPVLERNKKTKKERESSRDKHGGLDLRRKRLRKAKKTILT
jgi:hypothetical protein